MFNTILYKLKLKKPPESQMSRDGILNALPLRNKLIEWELDEKGEISLVIPQKQKLWVRMASKLFMLPEKRVVVLDEVGSYVWQQCDGSHAIHQIVQGLCKRYKMTRKEAETSLFQYMRQLGKRGIIGFAVPRNTKGGKK